ncbi:hydroxyacylglutathione hydrolase [cyanobacterium endosymbiont of Epithemia turgida]|uniref:hydroxyacylglutathione hydrolase n=1 Tax=cyanobacterium endosymbiont of Epithemia turgida TaxID=718217 RepID=UPI0004D11A28|nr:hydroxyacylglutathione hydrolase [cyanobacterium endosymbiont of Epithemia turgida]BAP16927.1 glyoxalase II [cyanobacterium endosymbiont of Epithemia turgida isolate EtSB Lake Yunoko]
MDIKRLSALSNNYIFVLHNPTDHTAAVVDPAEATPVLRCLDELEARLVAIFNTHHHCDHIGANNILVKKFPNLCVYGGIEDRGRIPHQQVFLKEGDRVKFANRVGEIIFVPGHTRAHIAYYFCPESAENTGELFCGDTLFSGGCGRLFEGNPAQMVSSLDKLRNLPDKTRVWCAHEYTLKNLQFAVKVDPDNEVLKKRFDQVKKMRQEQQATVPFLLGEEKKTNPFLRWDSVSLQSIVGVKEPEQVFGKIRAMKNNFLG